ncbi:uncharacterized protein N7511_001150 [Penicillium nucicola]|uniref:uncharacterized protein n=1 Tax=Penicillium nucicola TaxID=1850975 RepID=UPI00254572A3|nr:uncharacterized protein N7511_001150 [Penicillium nucicola]KAJ5776139.1 hypothetical protein N7511_001150 [Penicillium nucicola]
MASHVARSGITTDAITGERYIPSSVRADGSKRKEIRVKPGYRPPEDVEVYKTGAAAAWKNRAKGGVPGAERLSTGEDKTTAATTAATAASNKNAKRREAKRQTKENDQPTSAETKGVESNNWRAQAAAPAPPKKEEKPAEEPVDVEAEKEKKARNLKKKLRQARDLRLKKQQGEALLPEQLEKVIKIQELVRQLDMLGFDSNGDKKTDEK